MKYEINRGGVLYTIEPTFIRGGAPWVATRKGGAETLVEGRNPHDVLWKLIDTGLAAQHGLPEKLQDWNEVRRF